mmetsp:Transcript_3835/g.7328  ORF Transcript_3835/g.7328 Transcript_3835/m.7328 type:complete len:396 (+) Transcript_3835:1024-2211(+)
METDGTFPAGFDQIEAREAIDAFPIEVSVLTSEVGDVMSELNLQVALPPSSGRWQPQHLGHGFQLLRIHVLQLHLLGEKRAEPEDFFQTWEIFAFDELVLEICQFRSLVGAFCGLGDLACSGQHDRLPEVRHLLLGLKFPGHGGVVVLLLEESGRKHVWENPEKDRQSEFRKWDDQEQGEGDELEAVGCSPDQKPPLSNAQLISKHDPFRQVVGRAQISTEQSESCSDPLQKVNHCFADVPIPNSQNRRVIDKRPKEQIALGRHSLAALLDAESEFPKHLASLCSIGCQVCSLSPRRRRRRRRGGRRSTGEAPGLQTCTTPHFTVPALQRRRRSGARRSQSKAQRLGAQSFGQQVRGPACKLQPIMSSQETALETHSSEHSCELRSKARTLRLGG